MKEITEMTVEGRRDLRERLLSDLYDYYFANEGGAKDITSECGDVEKKLAYRFLADQGLISLDMQPPKVSSAASTRALITSAGILEEEDRCLVGLTI